MFYGVIKNLQKDIKKLKEGRITEKKVFPVISPQLYLNLNWNTFEYVGSDRTNSKLRVLSFYMLYNMVFCFGFLWNFLPSKNKNQLVTLFGCNHHTEQVCL